MAMAHKLAKSSKRDTFQYFFGKDRIMIFLKKLLPLLVCTVMLINFTVSAVAVSITYDSLEYVSSTPAFVEDGTTYVSARSLLDMRDTNNATFDGKTAHFSADGLELHIGVGDNFITANGEPIFFRGNVKLVDGRVSVPVRALAQALGARVDYDSINHTVTLKTVGNYIGNNRSYSENELYWMSRIICAESCLEPYLGKLLVGEVIMNRVKSASFPNTVYDVIFDTKYAVQFTPVANGTVYKTPCNECTEAAAAVLSGAQRERVALYFVNTNIVPVSWVSENRPALYTVGGHTFFS